MTIELLVVPNCPNSAAAEALLQQALHELGREDLEWRRTVVEDQVSADQLGFTGSPSFHVRGLDVFPQAVAPAVACRLYRTPLAERGLPAPGELAQALDAALRAPGHTRPYA